MPTTLVLATGNAHKASEIEAILGPNLGLILRTLLDFDDAPDLPETSDSFEGNARQKATGCVQFTGLPSLADDSGLVIDALDGRPGLFSARYAPTSEERIARVLREMRDVPDAQRTARFVAVVALALPDGRCVVREGRCEGVITRTPKGDKGFGYDPIFFIPEAGQTLAEMDDADKNRISHRGKALQLILPDIRDLLSLGRGILP